LSDNGLHVAISTAQTAAIVIPILSVGKPGDSVLFINSVSAKSLGWTDRSAQVLKENGFSSLPNIDVDDDVQLNIFAIAGLIRQRLGNYLPQYAKTFVHLNGGQKMTAIGLFEAVQNENITFVYMDNQPVQLVILEQGKIEYRPVPFQVELNDVLKLYGSRISPDMAIPKPVKLENTGLPAMAQEALLAATLFKIFERPDDPGESKQNDLRTLLDEIQPLVNELSLENSRNRNLSNTPINRFLKKPWDKEQSSRPLLKEEAIRNCLKTEYLTFYKSLKNMLNPNVNNNFRIQLNEDESRSLHKHGFIRENQTAGINPSDIKQRLGFYFEAQVLTRLQHFLAEHNEFEKIISEIWSGLKLTGENKPAIISGEYDIFLLLRNGIGISLECKTFLFEEKDLFARIARLNRRTSILSQQWLVIPFYTEPEIFNKRMLDNYITLLELGIPVIPFGRIGQPDHLIDHKTGEKIIVQNFETALSNKLKIYLG